MIDLVKLEKELDEALARETPESLLAWLNKQRERFPIETITPKTKDGEADWKPYYRPAGCLTCASCVGFGIVC